MTTGADVIAQARTWLGVPWVHQGRSREGIDCLGLVICVARAQGLGDVEYLNYGLANNPAMLFDCCDEHMDRVALEDAAPGDVAAIQYRGVPHHLAFFGDALHGGLSLVHALNLWGRQVVEHRLDDAWRRRIVRAYRLRGLA